MKTNSEKDKYDFSPSKLTDESIKKISTAKDAIKNIWDNKKGEYGEDLDKEIKFSEVIKQIFVCLPNVDMPGHQHNINFLIEYKDNLSEELHEAESDIGEELERNLLKLFSNVEVNVYSKQRMIDAASPDSMSSSYLKQQNEAIAHAGIPINQFNCQTLEQFHDQIQANFAKWKKQEISTNFKSSTSVQGESKDFKSTFSSPNSSTKKSDFQISKQEQILSILDLTQEKFSTLSHEKQNEILQIIGLLMEKAEIPKPNVTSPEAQSMIRPIKQELLPG